jgi:hypothetical protein
VIACVDDHGHPHRMRRRGRKRGEEAEGQSVTNITSTE